MFAGHYGASFAAKGLESRVPLWHLFVAAQFVDVLWGVLVALGVEKARAVPGINATLPLDLYYMPFTHSLAAAFAWAGGVALAYGLATGGACRNYRAGGVVGLVMLSHWVLDLLVHRPDLPLIGDSYKVGLGLWEHAGLAFAAEAVILFAGIAIYLRSVREAERPRPAGVVAFGIALMAVHYVALFVVKPPSVRAAALGFVALYLALAAMAYWLERPMRRGQAVARSARAGG